MIDACVCVGGGLRVARTPLPATFLPLFIFQRVRVFKTVTRTGSSFMYLVLGTSTSSSTTSRKDRDRGVVKASVGIERAKYGHAKPSLNVELVDESDITGTWDAAPTWAAGAE